MDIKIEYTWQRTAAELFQKVKPKMEEAIPRMQQTEENDLWHAKKPVFSNTVNVYGAVMRSLDFEFIEAVNQRMCLVAFFGEEIPFKNDNNSRNELIGMGVLMACLLCDIEKPDFVQQVNGSEKTICFPDHVSVAEHTAKDILKQCGFNDKFATWVSLLIRNSYQPYHAFKPSVDRLERINQFITCDFDSKLTAWIALIARPSRKQLVKQQPIAIEEMDTVVHQAVGVNKKQSTIEQQYKTMFCLSLMLLAMGQMTGSDFSQLDPESYTNMFNAYKEMLLKFSFRDDS